jgi:orotate phosphoribosyltransferase
MTREELAREIHRCSLLRGSFKLRSGAVSDRYFDKYLFESSPRLLAEIARALVPLVPGDIDALAGLELGGIPLATMLSQETGIPTLFVRKKAKDYGTLRLAEGGEVKGRNLLVVEDVITSGGQVMLSTADLRELGATVKNAVCVIDRESGGSEKLASVGVELVSLFRMSELEQAAGM